MGLGDYDDGWLGMLPRNHPPYPKRGYTHGVGLFFGLFDFPLTPELLPGFIESPS